MADARGAVEELVAGVVPLDEREEADRVATLRWVRAGAPLFRGTGPDKHLCVYFVLLDAARRTVLLADHVKSGLWLPPGGHVDDDENPRVTVVREAAEELGIDAEFHPLCGDDPLFLTVTDTVEVPSHTDVTFWFVLNGDQDMPLRPDPREAHEVRWHALDEPAHWAHDRFDPQMPRFRAKLLSRLD
jgi:8-oxo-dGTP diphosphatase